MSYLSLPVKIVKNATLEYRYVHGGEEPPKPTEGYAIHPAPREIEGVQGKLWLEYRLVE